MNNPRLFHFGGFELDERLLELRVGRTTVPLHATPWRLLLYLIENRERVVGKRELLEAVWPDAVVSDTALSTALKEIRRALGDDGAQQRWIRTQRGRGYRLVANVTVGPAAEGQSSPASIPAPGVTSPAVTSDAWNWASTLPFVGRHRELTWLDSLVEKRTSGPGRIRVLVGEAGIGKTRLLEEWAHRISAGGGIFLHGACFEGVSLTPFGPFAHALSHWVKCGGKGALDALSSDHSPPLARLIPELGESLGREGPLPALSPHEERIRLWDAIVRLLVHVSRSNPVVLAVDDLQWCDADSLGLLRYIVRNAGTLPISVLVAHRPLESQATPDVFEALMALRRESDYAELVMDGLRDSEIGVLFEALCFEEFSASFQRRLCRLTNGNPFFIREILVDWTERKQSPQNDKRLHVEEQEHFTSLPYSVRQLFERRLKRLSESTRRFLTAASCFKESFDLEVVARIAGLESDEGLEALDESLDAQLLRPLGAFDRYEFVHALAAEFLYSGMNRSRRVRLHRKVAADLQSRWVGDGPSLLVEIAYHYSRSASLSDPGDGFRFCVLAAEQSESVGAHADAAGHWRTALRYLPRTDEQYPRVLGRLALALAWSQQIPNAMEIAAEAGALLAQSTGDRSAADFLADAADAIWMAEYNPAAWQLAEQGLRHTQGRRDLTFVRLSGHHLARRQAQSPEPLGILLDSPEHMEISKLLLGDPGVLRQHSELWRYIICFSRAEVLDRASAIGPLLVFWAGEYTKGLAIYREQATLAERQGRFLMAAQLYTQVAYLESALGYLDASAATCARAKELAERVRTFPYSLLSLTPAPAQLALLRGSELEGMLPLAEALLSGRAPENEWTMSPMRAGIALLFVSMGFAERASDLIGEVRPAIERAPGWAPNYTPLVGFTCDVFWTLGQRPTYSLEEHVRKKTLEPDFRYPHCDARLSLARLSALEERYDEARHWFKEARAVLRSQGARPLLAIADYDEALMYCRRSARWDAPRIRELTDRATAEFQALGMPGWVARSEALGERQ